MMGRTTGMNNGHEAALPGLTALLQAWSLGDASALERLTPIVYSELHRLAPLQIAGACSPAIRPRERSIRPAHGQWRQSMGEPAPVLCRRSAPHAPGPGGFRARRRGAETGRTGCAGQGFRDG